MIAHLLEGIGRQSTMFVGPGERCPMQPPMRACAVSAGEPASAPPRPPPRRGSCHPVSRAGNTSMLNR